MFASAVSVHPDARVATGEVVGEVLERLGPRPDLVVLFLTAAHLGAAPQVVASVGELLEPGAMIGAGASAVIGGPRGIEDAPGLVLWAARFAHPVRSFRLEAEPQGSAVRVTGLERSQLDGVGAMLLLADPFSFPTTDFLAGLTADHPGVAVIGGLASAGQAPGGNRLVHGRDVHHRGAVGVLLEPDVAPATVVSQGCRPIGAPYTVTKATGNLVEELGGMPALRRVEEILQGLSAEERALAAQGLHCGIVADEHQLDFHRGDFLIRGVLGADRRTGVVAIGEVVEVGATLQFQVRDPDTAGDDLRALLLGHDGASALVFTCNGRGTFMFGDPHHDAVIVQDHLGPAPVAGMFCAGELGPVGARNALHGFTASVALFGGGADSLA